MHIIEQSELDGMPCPDTLIHGECLESMKHIADGSVDMILADLPYQITNLKWDVLIPFEPLWEAYKRVIKPNGAIVLTASQPFTSALVMSNPKMFRYEWIWEKTQGSNFAMANRRPIKEHESICVFSCNPSVYYPIRCERKPGGASRAKYGFSDRKPSPHISITKDSGFRTFDRLPGSVLHFNSERGLHPTQKPSKLFEYLVQTYTNPGDLVLDNTMGSATTPVACLNTGRHFIGIELDDTYFAAGCARVRARQLELASVLPL